MPRSARVLLGFCVWFLFRGQAAGRLPRSAERGILPAPAGASVRGFFFALFERFSVGKGQALPPPDPRMRQALRSGTPGVSDEAWGERNAARGAVNPRGSARLVLASEGGASGGAEQ